MKTTIITMLLLAAGVCAMAQEKWEYGVVRYIGMAVNKSYTIYFNTSTENIIETGKIDKGTGCEDLRPMLQYLDNLTKQGWEVYNISNHTMCEFFYHLRKKKQ